MRAKRTTAPRLKRGRPPRDYSNDPDIEVAEWAIALQAARNMSERRAIDLALAICQGEAGPPSRVPRGAKAGILVGYKLPIGRGFHGRAADIRRKIKAGKLRPNHDVVFGIACLLYRMRRLGL